MPTSPSRIPILPPRRHSPAPSMNSTLSRVLGSRISGRTDTSALSSSTAKNSYKSISVSKIKPEVGEGAPPRLDSGTSYVSTHLGDSCTIGALDHILTCGHKVMTERADNCASNCKHSTSDFSNPRSMDEQFVCMACLSLHVDKNQKKRFKSFRSSLRALAEESGRLNWREWIEQKVEVMEIGWKEVRFNEFVDKAKLGRFARPFYLDPEYQQYADLAFGKLASSPVENRLKGSHKPGIETRVLPALPPSPPESHSSFSSSKRASKLPVFRK